MILLQTVSVEKEILDFFADRNFERSRRFAPDVYNPKNLAGFLAQLGNPQYRYETIHVAGTVGKGSITTYLARALRTLGFRTGAYFSPHVVSLCERFWFDGAYISGAMLESFWQQLKDHPELNTLSFFDALTALAFRYFSALDAEWAVIETGLGGRCDSTNNLHAKIAVLTLIDLDHQNILGNSIEAIAHEKAGIIKPGQTVYSVMQQDTVLQILKDTCALQGAELKIVETQAAGYLDKNRQFALAVIADAFNPPADALSNIQEAMAEPIFGRLSLIQSEPRVFFDGGHNAAAMRALAHFVNQQGETACNIFLNTMKERDLTEFVAILRQNITRTVNFYFLPMAENNYYTEPPPSSGLIAVTDTEIRKIIGLPGFLNLFTGSMVIYKELQSRLAL